MSFFIVEKPVAMVLQPSWNAFQGTTGENASENPFVQPPVVATGADSGSAKVFMRLGLLFPNLLACGWLDLGLC